MRKDMSGDGESFGVLVEQMRNRWEELMTLRASPDMYGSESLDGQLAELELWLLRLQQHWEAAA